VQIAPSCSLLHVPVDVEAEAGLDGDVKSWLAFSVQKMTELSAIAGALRDGRDSVKPLLDANASAVATRKHSRKVHDYAVQARVNGIAPSDTHRHSAFAVRAEHQQRRFTLPIFPTTTIGSFPQTPEVR